MIPGKVLRLTPSLTSRSFIGLLWVTLVALALAVAPAARAQTAQRIYELNGSYAETNGGSALVPNGGTLGATGYTFAAGQGPNVSNALANTGEYSIEMVVRIDGVTGGYQNLINFNNRTNDFSIYSLGGSIYLYNYANGKSPSVDFVSGQTYRIVITRSASSKVTTAYVNGLQKVQVTDTSDLFVASAAGGILHFFRDDGSENASGFIDQIRIYHSVLTPNQVAALSWQAVVNAGSPTVTRYTPASGSSPVAIDVGNFAAGSARSFEFVFNAAGAGPSKSLLGSRVSASGIQALKIHQFNNTGKFGITTIGVADYVFNNSPTLSNQQVHAVYTSNGAVTTLYLNGVAQSGTINQGLAITGRNGLGAIEATTQLVFDDNLDGTITGFASYARALTQAEVTARYNALAGVAAPGAPTIGTATRGNASASVAFTAPASNGGSAITSYTVTSSPGGRTATGSASPITVTGLTNGTAYTFTVTATNTVGTGSASTASNSVTPATVPGAPTIGTATRGNASASVAFTAPANNGGSAVTSYTVTSSPGGLTATGSASPITVTGLTNGTAYTFTVTATNTVGASAASTASNSVTPATVPGAPTIGTATRGNASASVAFSAPASNGGSAVTSYTVTSSPGSLTATGSASPITVTGLTNGTAYTFTVTATNVVGAGSASSASSSVTPATVPGAPTIGTATRGNASASVAFTAPAHNGGSAVTSYTVTSSPGGLTATGSASPITVTGLTNGTAYTFTVTATNAVGTGSPSAASNSVTPFPPPTVTSISPNAGPPLGGTPVTITGTNFIAPATVTIGGNPATGVSVVNATTITAITPPGTAGSASVLVTTAIDTNPANTLFTFGDPDITVLGNGIDIVHADTTPDLADHTDFGSTAETGGTLTRTFIITNSGVTSLNLGSVTIGGAHAADFIITRQPAASLAPTRSTTFKVRFDPSATGLRSAILSVANDDPNEAPFTFAISGTGRAGEMRIFSWGLNSNGQVGDGTTTRRTVPVATNMGALAGKTIVDVVVGGGHSVALTTEGKLYAWGANSYGQLGDGTNTNRLAPVAVDMSGVLAGKTVVAVSASDSTIAVTSDGKVYGWGLNDGGQLGDGTKIWRNLPVEVDMTGVLAGKSVTEVYTALNGKHTLVLTTDGKLYGWGSNNAGQLGIGTTSADITTPVEVNTTGVLLGKTIIDLGGGNGGSSAALTADGKVYTWGFGGNGRLGTGSTSNRSLPGEIDTTGVLAGKFITALSMGEGGTIVMTNEAKLYTWGRNDFGQLGDGTTVLTSLIPVAVDMSGVLLGKTPSAISLSGGTSFVVTTEGKVYGFGGNLYAQLGIGTPTSYFSNVPVAVDSSGVLANAFVQKVGGGNTHSLALASVPSAPGAPTIETVTPLDTSVSVAFSAPASDGGSAITSYTVTSSPGGFTATGSASPLIVTGLTNGTAYTFTVTATNAIGTGAVSAASASVTPIPLPTITGILPASDFTVGGTTLTITGRNFTGATGATIGGAAATNFVVVSATSITCTVPPGTAGSANVLVSSPIGLNTPNSLFTYVAAPVFDVRSNTHGVEPGPENMLNTGLTILAGSTVTIAVHPADLWSLNGRPGNASGFPSSFGGSNFYDSPTYGPPNAQFGALVYTLNGTNCYSVASSLTATRTTFVASETGVLRLGNWDSTSTDNNGTDVTLAVAVEVIAPVVAAPTVNSPTSANITATTATIGGTVADDGGAAILSRGVVYSITTTNANPVIFGTGVTLVAIDGTTGVFTANLGGLASLTGYSYRAYATNSQGVSYSDVATFTTLTPPAITFADWSASQGLSGADALATAQPFGDGVPNLLKYAFNMPLDGPRSNALNPTAGPGANGLPVFTPQLTGPNPTFRAQFLRRKNSGLNYVPQRSTSLTAPFTPMLATQVVTPIDAEWELVTVDEPLGLPLPATFFGRVQITLP